MTQNHGRQEISPWFDGTMDIPCHDEHDACAIVASVRKGGVATHGNMRRVLNENGTVSQHCVRTLHAEQNAIIQAAKFGIALDGSTLYCKMTPCRTCAMIIINSGIKRVVCEKHYHADKDTIELFKLADVELVVMNEEVEEYDRQ